VASVFRVGELAEAAGISVALVRSYQTRGLLSPPRREGRVAWYDERHLERLRAIGQLKTRGYPLKMAAAALAESGPPDRGPPTDGDEILTLSELAERSRVAPAVLRSLMASGLLRPRQVPVGRGSSESRYTGADVHAVRMLLVLLGSGLPMEELMEVARAQLDHAQEVADGAVTLFLRYGRQPLLDAGLTQREEAERMVEALHNMVEATTSLLTYNFSRMVTNAAHDAIQRDGTRAERAALGNLLAGGDRGLLHTRNLKRGTVDGASRRGVDRRQHGRSASQ
jgi:DNA-binding transcriptional MerR regulator